MCDLYMLFFLASRYGAGSEEQILYIRQRPSKVCGARGLWASQRRVYLRLGKARRNYMMMHFLSFFSLGEMVPEAGLDVGAALRPVLGCRRSCCRLRCRAARESSSFCNCRAIC